MKACLTFYLSLVFASALFAQNEATFKGDTILVNNSSIGVILKDGAGWKISALDGKWWISAKEGGFTFSTGEMAYPHTTVFSKEATIQTLLSYSIFSKASLNPSAIARLVKKYPVKRSVLPELRTNPRSTTEE
jgi:hypothetical protein